MNLQLSAAGPRLQLENREQLLAEEADFMVVEKARLFEDAISPDEHRAEEQTGYANHEEGPPYLKAALVRTSKRAKARLPLALTRCRNAFQVAVQKKVDSGLTYDS